jgi:cell division protein FtsW (lipid II flippase)
MVSVQKYTLLSSYANKKFGAADLIGNGLNMTPRLIPEVHTDFILTYITYSFGWLAAFIALVMIVFFIYRILSTAKIVSFTYGRILINGLATTFATQFILSILTNLGLLPLPGVPFPFMSFGGSHIMLEMIAVGLILSIYRRRNTGDIYWLDIKNNS